MDLLTLAENKVAELLKESDSKTKSTSSNAASSGPKRASGATNVNYNSFVNNGTAECNPEDYDGKNEVKEIKVFNEQGVEVKYGEKITNDHEYTYKVTKFDEKDKDNLEGDMKKVKWCFWLPEVKGFQKKTTLICNKNKKPDTEKDFIYKNHKSDAARIAAIKKNAIIYAKKEIIEKDGKKTAVLRIRFSKWLDGEMIKVEAYLKKPKMGGGDTVASRVLQTQPQIVEAFWLNAASRVITSAGYKQDIYLYLKTLGLKGKTVEVQVFDEDLHQLDKDDAIEWKNNKIKIEKRDAIKQFKVGDKARYKEAQKDEKKEEDNYTTLIDYEEKTTYDLELYIHIANSEALKIKDIQYRYGELKLTPEEKVVTAFFAQTRQEEVQADAPEQKKTPKTKVPYYKKIDEGVIGQKVQLVAECPNLEGKEVTFIIYEKESLLVEKDTALPLLQDDKEVTEIKAKVENGFAEAEIVMQEVDSDKYKEWDKKLDPDTGKLKTSYLFIKVSCKDAEIPVIDKPFLNEDKKLSFNLGAAIIIYNITWEGKIEKKMCDAPQKAMYKYQDKDTKIHYLGKAKVHKTRRHIKQDILSKKKGDDILLAYSKDIESYTSTNVKFKFATWNSTSGRWYINPDCFAGLLGAMIEESIEDLGFNGFSIKNGNTAGGSSSHINGQKGDLRYLSTNKNGERTELEDKHFDYDRQVKFNNALYKFGWGNKAKMYSENYYRKTKKEVINPKTKKKEIKEDSVKTLLPHCKHMKKTTGSPQYRHHHHLHLTGFDHSKIISK